MLTITRTTSPTWTSWSADLSPNSKKLGLREKTLIVFTGDNGTAGSSERAT